MLSKPLKEWDRDIRAGQAVRVQQALLRTNPKDIARSDLASICGQLARRCGEPFLSLRWLNPYVRPGRRRLAPASEGEKAEYAGALIEAGAVEEAKELLQGIDALSEPKADLFLSFAYIAQWDYGSTLPILRRYVSSPALSDYQRLVGKVNLAAALVHENAFAESQPLLYSILEELRKADLKRLLGNTLELLAQQSLFQADWAGALGALEEANRLLRDSPGNDLLFVHKWQAILTLLQKPGSSSAAAALRQVKRRATAARHWETLRDCDRFFAIARNDQKLAIHLYFGTPHVCFRNWMWDRLADPITVPTKYLWYFGSRTKQKRAAIDLFGVEGAAERLRNNGLLFRMAQALASDFYRPLRIATWYSRVYPGEFFNPFTSPTRMHQGIRRLRRWLKEERLPLVVEELRGTYRLASPKPIALKIPSPDQVDSWARTGLRGLQNQLVNGQALTSAEVSRCLGIPNRTAVRRLAQALEEGLVERVGAGAATRYRALSKRV